MSDMIGNQIVISPENIELKKKLKIGIMPNTTILSLEEQDLANLSSYLLTLKTNAL